MNFSCWSEQSLFPALWVHCSLFLSDVSPAPVSGSIFIHTLWPVLCWTLEGNSLWIFRVVRVALCIFGTIFGKLWPLWSPWTLSSTPWTQGVFWALAGFPFLYTIAWRTSHVNKSENCRTHLICFPSQGSLSFITWCLVFWKPSFYIFCIFLFISFR